MVFKSVTQTHLVYLGFMRYLRFSVVSRRWKPGQPDSWTNHGLGPGDEDCAHLHADGRLNDLHCSTKMCYICQKHSLHT